MAGAAGRILALDFGARRIGVAVSDPLGLTAQGLPTLERSTPAADLESLRLLAREYQAVYWLLGLPRQMSGGEGSAAARVRRWGAQLQRHTGLPVHYWDERLTSVEAQRVLRDAGPRLNQPRGAVDRIAAAILLQSYLDASSQSRIVES